MNDREKLRRAKFKTRVQAWAKRLKVHARQVRIQEMRRKWGSCSTLGYVSFASDLLKKRFEFQEYVIVHELLHLRIPNHRKLFKLTLSAHLPAATKQLNGSTLLPRSKPVMRVRKSSLKQSKAALDS